MTVFLWKVKSNDNSNVNMQTLQFPVNDMSLMTLINSLSVLQVGVRNAFSLSHGTSRNDFV